ncbi:MAG TPA: hypothetical protein VMF29_02260 [Candidatus Edwardsbacteria bacterium]|nr:hypothetical protein [Candidatus Edwardsbacteria bacterium]
MKRMMILAAAIMMAAIAWAQNAGPEEPLTGQWFITGMTTDKILIPDTDGMPYSWNDVTVTDVNGQTVSNLGQMRFPCWVEIRYTYEGDAMKLRELHVKIEYYENSAHRLVPSRWSQDRARQASEERAIADER